MALLLLVCLYLMPYTALAASTADAKEPILLEKECTLTLSYRCDGVPASAQPVQLSLIAEVSADGQYTLVPSFAATGLVLNGIQTNGEWNVIRTTLEAQILANNIASAQTAVTDKTGAVCFDGMKPGLYLVSAVYVSQDDLRCLFDSALIAVPGMNADGLWQYDISVTPKPEELPPVVPDEDMEFRVLKLWKGDERNPDRPQSVEIEIFCDGIPYDTAVLSETNHWSYSWTAKDNGANWKVVERNIPDGYMMTLEERETTFVLTNVWVPENPETPPSDSPQTGDTSNILLYAVIMFVSGTMLIVLGMTGKRNCHEETT